MNWAIWLAMTAPMMLAAILNWIAWRRRREPLKPALAFFGAALLALTIYGLAFGLWARWEQAQCWHHHGARAVCRNLPPEGVRGLYFKPWWA